MDNFTDSEKEELLRAAGSSELREEFRHMARNRQEFRKNDGTVDLDRVVRFVSDMNALLNYPRKPFKRMTGNNFKI